MDRMTLELNTVSLISATTTHWSIFIQTCIKLFGSSPTRELDSRGMRLADPKSFAFSLEVLNGGSLDLKKAYRSLDFIHLTFLIRFEDEDQFLAFCNLSNICKLTWSHKSGPIGLFCGSLKQLKEFITVACKSDILQEVRFTANKMYIYLEQAGYKELFGNKKALGDGTFILE